MELVGSLPALLGRPSRDGSATPGRSIPKLAPPWRPRLARHRARGSPGGGLGRDCRATRVRLPAGRASYPHRRVTSSRRSGAATDRMIRAQRRLASRAPTGQSGALAHRLGHRIGPAQVRSGDQGVQRGAAVMRYLTVRRYPHRSAPRSRRWRALQPGTRAARSVARSPRSLRCAARVAVEFGAIARRRRWSVGCRGSRTSRRQWARSACLDIARRAPFGAHLPRPHRRLGGRAGDEFSTRTPSNVVPPW